MRAGSYSLRTALMLFILLPLVLLTSLAGWYSLQGLERQIRSRMQEDIELIARAIRVPLSDAMARGREGAVARTLLSALQISRVYGAYVYDANGHQIAATGPRSPTKQRKAAQLVLKGQRQGEFERIHGKPFFSYFVPLTDSGGRITGLLQITRKGIDFQEYISRVRYQALGLLAFTTFLLAIVIFYGHHRAFGRPMRAIRDSLVLVGRGERQHRVPLQGPREIQELSSGINTMLDKLAEHADVLAEQQAQQEQLALRLRQSEKMAAIGRLAAGVAHELGTPLSVIDGRAQRAMRSVADASLASALGDIRREVERVSSIIRQLMDFSRNNPLRRQSVTGDRMLRSVLAMLSDEFNRHKIDCHIEAAGQSPLFYVDRLRIEQALSNVVRNALQAADRRVRIGWFESHATKGFVVEDDGPGVDRELRQRIFEPFFTTKAVNEGTGLGLAVAHAALEAHGGYIQIDRSPDLGGARMRIVLPDQMEEV